MPALPIIVFTTVLTFSALYLPQPILPLLAREFAVTQTEAALLTAVTMVPLGLAPIFYGYLAEYFSAKRLLRIAIGLLVANEAALALVGDFWMMVGLRFVQGLLLPAIFTSLMTYSAYSASGRHVRRAMNFYIGATILGGFSGRFLGGFVSEHFQWRYSFALVAALLAVAWVGLGSLRGETRSRVDLIGLGALRDILAQPLYRNAYFGLFLVFFVFASVLNYIPFRLTTLDPEISESRISLMYIGYLSGALIAVNGVRIARWLGGEIRGLLIGLTLLAVGLGGMLLQNVTGIFLFMLVLCAGFFLVHSLLSAFLNHYATEAKGVINGLYISFYYSGGALGGWLPGFIYRELGWNAYIATLGLLLATAAWWMSRMRAAVLARGAPAPL